MLFNAFNVAAGYATVLGLNLIGIQKHEYLEATAFAAGIVCLVDGIVLAWFPQLYGSSKHVNDLGSKPGAGLLFAVGWVLLAAVHLSSI